MSGALVVIYRDDALLAVDKPSGMLVHRGLGVDRTTLVDLVRKMLCTDTVYPVHRLDRGTSGVVLFAQSASVARAVSEAFAQGKVDKRYLALVRGVAPPFAIVDSPVPNAEGGPRMPAVTEVRTLATIELEPRALSLVEATPRCGRLHQVRRHLKHLGHPVIGDANYGKGALNRAFAERYGLTRLALHAARLSLVHPVLATPLVLSAPLPEDLAAPLSAMGFRLDDVGYLPTR